ncbi:MAG: type II toxin-antitoxin system prevent-host-death family antitoxin, partial [Acidobacteriota bacterium]|nr:type II toxin-antitoxin system prevent-host-death family antitoxin [Acidobacteriota bacterium]
VTVHEAKTNLSQLLRKVAQGEQVIISRGKEPVARLVAINKAESIRQPGSMKGTLLVDAGFFEPLPDQELAAWD